jgi:DNA-binding GntR family transcriptional regulator
VPADVYRRMHEDIVSGELAPGTPLIETSLASHYGTSRTPIREALRRLEQDGLAERAARSMRVRSASPEQILEIYDVRIALEGIAARSAAEHATELDLLRLNTAQQAMREADNEDSRALAQANRHFHETLWQAAHNSTLLDLLSHLNAHLLRYPETTLSWPGRLETALEEHDVLLDAIGRRDGVRAQHIAEEHMRSARNIRLNMYAERPGNRRPE